MPSAGKQLSQLAAEFRDHPDATPHASLDAVVILEHLLTAMGAVLTDLVRGQPVLVLGCADDALALFLESLGCSVLVADVDAPDATFGLALVDPASVPSDPQPLLEALSRVADYCLFPRTPEVSLLNHAGWELCVTDTAACILRRSDLFTNGRLLEGWYPVEGARDGWRWSADLAKIRFQTPRNGWVRFLFFVPPDRLRSTGPFTAGAMMEGVVLASTAIAQHGVHHLEIPIIRPQGATSDLTFWISPGAVSPGDERLLGVIVRQILFVAAAQ
jgi:hypothetical protein